MMHKSTFGLSPSDKSHIFRLWKSYLHAQMRNMCLAILCMMILAAATASYAYVVSFIVDRARDLQGHSQPMKIALNYGAMILPLIISITLISGLSNYAQRMLCHKIVLHVIERLQNHMLESLQRADYAFFAQTPVGILQAKFTHDVNVISTSLIRVLSNLIKDLLSVILLITVMFTLSWPLSILILIIYPLAAIPILRISKYLRKNATDLQAHIGELTAELKDNFSAARLIKVYGLEGYQRAKLGASFKKRLQLYLKLISNQARIDPILEISGGLAIAGVMVFGAYLITSEQATPGHIAGLLTNLLLLSPRIRALGTLNSTVQEGLAVLTSTFDLIDKKPRIIDIPSAKTLPPPQGHIKFDRVGFTYPNGILALKSVTVEAKAGQTIALVGPSGSGKTSLLHLLTRLYDTDSGRILIDDMDIKHLTLASLRQNIAFVTQHVSLFRDSISANIGLGKLGATQAEIVAAAHAAEAHHFIMELAQGYDTILNENGENLSGGQRQRLSIARALLRDAPILLLDEATSALDSQTDAKIQTALKRLTHERTTFIIAHNLSHVEQADIIYVFDKGEITQTGHHNQLINQEGLYKRLIQS